jgi:ATP-dependent Lhr-like helicase
MVLERFFDESGGMQLVVHSVNGSRINRAFGLALRKRFCRGFGFELQAAANEEAIVISLSEQHSFELAGVFDYLRSASAKDLLVQALLAAPMFTSRWRWNVSRALLLPRVQGGKRVPPPIARMRADDLLAQSFPQAMACGETLPPGDIEVPMDHPIVRQTVEDCLNEAMDIDGFLAMLKELEDGRIARVAVDRPEPSPFARAILAAQPYTFLDDAPLEERRTQAVRARRALDPKSADDIGALDPQAVMRVRAEAWPEPESAEELHEALLWMGFVTDEEARGARIESAAADASRDGARDWRAWLGELARAGRVEHIGARWFATEAPKSGKEVLRGRLEALGPVDAEDPLIHEFAGSIRDLESEGAVLLARFPSEDRNAADELESTERTRAADELEGTERTRAPGRSCWCMRRLLARIHRYTLERLQIQIQPVSAAEFVRFLAHWQHAAPMSRLEGPRGVLAVVAQLAGFQAPARAWEKHIFPSRVNGYQSAWLERLALSGEIAWGRLWGSGSVAARHAPITFFARTDLETWLAFEPRAAIDALTSDAQSVHALLARQGPRFLGDLARETRLLPSRLESALAELVGHGLATCDAPNGLAFVDARLARRRQARERDDGRIRPAPGRWSLLAAIAPDPSSAGQDDAARFARAEFAARALLARTGVVFRRTIERERIPVPWRDLLIAMRRMEARGEIHGGRFVTGFHGEQYALPDAVKKLRALRRVESNETLSVDACDPLNQVGILTPDERIASNSRRAVQVLPVTPGEVLALPRRDVAS